MLPAQELALDSKDRMMPGLVQRRPSTVLTWRHPVPADGSTLAHCWKFAFNFGDGAKGLPTPAGATLDLAEVVWPHAKSE
jgi:hypothetical protein